MNGRFQQSSRRAGRWTVWFVLLCASQFAFSVVAQPISKDYQVKAVLLWRLAQFVTWPSNAFESAESPIVIGVLGADPFGNALDIAVQGETAHNRRIVVQRFRHVSEIRTCHLLYVSASERRQLRPILGSLSGRSILTVSDIEGFAIDYGGMIRLLSTAPNKVSLRVNIDEVKAANLQLDARLLRTAEIAGSK